MESLVIRLYKVYTMLMPGLESQSPEWTSTVSTGRVGGRKQKDEEQLLDRLFDVVINDNISRNNESNAQHPNERTW